MEFDDSLLLFFYYLNMIIIHVLSLFKYEGSKKMKKYKRYVIMLHSIELGIDVSIQQIYLTFAMKNKILNRKCNILFLKSI